MSSTESGPLLFEDLHRRVKELQPLVFTGLRLTFNKPLSSHFQLVHSVYMAQIGSHYKFGANYMGTKQVSASETYPILGAEVHGDGTMNANLIHLINPRIRTKVVGSFSSNQCTGSQIALEYLGDKFTSTITAANIDLIKNNGILVGQLLHQFTKSIAVGPELVIQYTEKDSKFNMIHQLSLGGKYDAEKYHIDATVSLGAAHISYYQKANENLQFGAELMTDVMSGKTNTGFYYKYDLTKANTTFKGSIDSAWNIGAVMEKRLLPLPIVFSLSAILNHPKNMTNVGFGLAIG